MKAYFQRLAFLVLTLFGTSALVAAEQLYTCAMHQQIIKYEPGNCPICGMKLTLIRASGADREASEGQRKIKYYKSTMTPGEVGPKPGKDSMGMAMVPVYVGDDSAAQTIQIEAATIQHMNLKTALVELGPVRREFRTVGTIAYDEQALRDITTRYEGWIEKLNVNATWAVVKAGDPLFEIYSPDLYNAELNFVVAFRSENDADGPLTRATRARLQLFDVSDEFIAELRRTGEPKRMFVFRAPTDGVVIEKMAIVGQMIKPGEKIYRLADLSTVWVLAQIYEKDLPFVREGQAAAVRTTYGPERVFNGKVQILVPVIEEQTRTATARIVLPNADHYLRPGMFADVSFSAQLAESAVLVPDMAVLRSGERNTVFIAKEGGSFEAREIKLGARSEGNFYEVISGLAAGERVVTSGQFMLDSESQLREAIQKMLKGDAVTSAPSIPEAATNVGTLPTAPQNPMVSHPSANDPAAPAVDQPANARKILRYQSSMAPGETSPIPAKDSMGMGMVPVYEELPQVSTPSVPSPKR